MRNILERFKILLVIISPAIGVGAFIGAYPGYKLYEFIWKDSRFCTSCHVHDYASVAWKESVHGKLTTCHDCHHQPLHAYAHEAFLMVSKRPKFPKDLHHVPYVPKDLCQACHVTDPHDQSTVTGPLSFDEIKKLPKVDKMRLHKIHLEKEVKISLPDQFEQDAETPSKVLSQARLITCMDCHGTFSNRAHYFTATDSSCIRCHQKKHETGLPSEVGCRKCHFQEFMVPL